MQKDDILFEKWEWLTMLLVVFVISFMIIEEHFKIVDTFKEKAIIDKEYAECVKINPLPSLIEACDEIRTVKLKQKWEEHVN